jgi:hypothetical protein
MRGIKVCRLGRFAGCVLVLSIAGCQAGGWTGGSWAWPWSQKPAVETKSGILAPSEQTKRLRQLAKDGPARPADEQQRLVGLLVESLQKQPDPLIRAEIVRTMAKFPTPAAGAAVRAALKDSEAEVRIAACELLGRPSDPGAVAALSETLTSDVEVDVRLAAARALGQSQDPAAVRALGVALDGPDPAMQYRAVASLRSATGKDFGNDVQRWRQYVKGGSVVPPQSPSLAERLGRLAQ